MQLTTFIPHFHLCQTILITIALLALRNGETLFFHRLKVQSQTIQLFGSKAVARVKRIFKGWLFGKLAREKKNALIIFHIHTQIPSGDTLHSKIT